MVKVDLYRLFYKSLKIKSKFKLATFRSYTMEIKYFSERVASTSFGTKKNISWAIVHKFDAVKKGPKDGGM